ncbi:hypothetical protein C8J56DRAFT_497977 [Mycena floridula]|nr:hypothetical protein C8J56DRAFT_497977 [Mycena floridula]
MPLVVVSGVSPNPHHLSLVESVSKQQWALFCVVILIIWRIAAKFFNSATGDNQVQEDEKSTQKKAYARPFFITLKNRVEAAPTKYPPRFPSPLPPTTFEVKLDPSSSPAPTPSRTVRQVYNAPFSPPMSSSKHYVATLSPTSPARTLQVNEFAGHFPHDVFNNDDVWDRSGLPV